MAGVEPATGRECPTCHLVNPPEWTKTTCQKCYTPFEQARTSSIPVVARETDDSAAAAPRRGADLDAIVLVLPDFHRVTVTPGDVIELKRHTEDQVVFEALRPFHGVHREAHAVLSFDPTGPMIKDVHPEGNGTFLNGVRLERYQALPVSPGDRILLGHDCNLMVEEPNGNG